MSIKTPKKTVFMGLATILLLSGLIPLWTVSAASSPEINTDAFVYILNMGISGNNLQYRGLRNAFAVGDGQYVLTAAHCVADFENTNKVLRRPMVISPYYGDIFEAEIVAVDDVNDIAILKPAWNAHPGLELETSENWESTKEIIIAGYPPMPKKRGGNGKTHTQEIKFEKVPLVRCDGQGQEAITVGPVKYAGEGWSGSPLIVPETGKIAGITCVKSSEKKTSHLRILYIFKIPITEKVWLIRGCDGHLIDSVFQKHQITYGATTSFPDSSRKHQFVKILETFDTFKPHNEKQIAPSIENLYNELPDSYITRFMTGAAFTDPDDAIAFEKNIQAAPDSRFLHAAYGNYLLSRNKLKKAAEQFQIVTERDPNHIFACYGRLSALVKTDPNAAEVLGAELIQRWPENAGFHFEYSKALRAKYKHKEELPVIQKAIELCGKGDIPFQYRRYLGDCLKANKQYEEAERAYQELLKTHECEHCWWAYTTLLLEIGPDKIKQAKKARDKTMTFIQDPNQVYEKQRFYENEIENMLSDPNAISTANY